MVKVYRREAGEIEVSNDECAGVDSQDDESERTLLVKSCRPASDMFAMFRVYECCKCAKVREYVVGDKGRAKMGKDEVYMAFSPPPRDAEEETRGERPLGKAAGTDCPSRWQGIARHLGAGSAV